MPKLRCGLLAASVFVHGFAATTALAQSRVVQFGNAMRTTIDVVLTPVGGAPLPKLTIAPDRTADFRFDGQKFDIQVIPQDDVDSGVRVPKADLDLLVRQSTTGVIQ